MKMYRVLIMTVAFAFVHVLYTAQSMKVVPQRTNITYFNDKYIKWCKIAIRRYGRKSDYYINIEGEKYHLWANNVSLHLIFNEYLHNEYRRSFVEMHFRLCGLLYKDPYVRMMLAKYLKKCPVVENVVHLMNLTVPVSDFPYEFPFEQSRVDIQVTIPQTKELIVEGNIYLLFKN